MAEEIERCEECGLPLVECNAVSIARGEAEQYLHRHGYAGLQAREAAWRLIPGPRRGGILRSEGGEGRLATASVDEAKVKLAEIERGFMPIADPGAPFYRQDSEGGLFYRLIRGKRGPADGTD